MERWVGRVAIVTGASAGIGADIARLLAENGMRVVGVARRVHRVQELAEEMKGCKGEIHAVHGDVTKEEDVLRVVRWTRDTLGGADVLVNNAGTYFHLPLTEFDTTKMRNLMDLNVIGLCLFTREVVKDMRERGMDDGHIFHISSIAGTRIVDYLGFYPYTASKHSVRVLTEGLRRELRDLKTKIRVTEISPGAVRSEIMLASGMTPEEMKKSYDSMGTILEPRDVSNALLYYTLSPRRHTSRSMKLPSILLAKAILNNHVEKHIIHSNNYFCQPCCSYELLQQLQSVIINCIATVHK